MANVMQKNKAGGGQRMCVWGCYFDKVVREALPEEGPAHNT